MRVHLYADIFLVSTCTALDRSWESVDAESRLYASIYAIFYTELEYSQILVSVGVLEPTSTLRIPRENLNLGGVKSYTQIPDGTGLSSPTRAWFKSQL